MRKLGVEALIFTGGMKLDNPQKLRKLEDSHVRDEYKIIGTVDMTKWWKWLSLVVLTPTFMITSE